MNKYIMLKLFSTEFMVYETGYIYSIQMKNCAADAFDYDVCMCILLCAF